MEINGRPIYSSSIKIDETAGRAYVHPKAVDEAMELLPKGDIAMTISTPKNASGLDGKILAAEIDIDQD